MKRFLYALVLVLGFAASASAQTVCPAGTSGATVKTNTTFTFAWCTSATPTITGGFVINGATKVPISNVHVVAGPFSDGQVQLHGDVVGGFPRGNYSVTVTQVTIDPAFGDPKESAPSSPFALSVADPIAPPAAPKNLRVQ